MGGDHPGLIAEKDAAQVVAGTDDPGKLGRAAEHIPVVPSLDGFRAAAVIGVLLWHCWGRSGNASGEGLGRLAAGVFPSSIYVLFIISGFVMFLPTAARGRFGSVRAYALRRIARIAPAYYLSLVIVLALFPMLVAPSAPLSDPSAANVLAHFGFVFQPLRIFDPVTYPAGFGVNGPVWTLSVEALFYVLLPLAALPFFRRPLVGMAVGFGIAILWRLFAFDDLNRLVFDQPAGAPVLERPGLFLNQLPFWTGALAVGMAAAWAFVRIGRSRYDVLARRIAVPIQLCALVALGVLAWVAGGEGSGGQGDTYIAAQRSIPISTAFPLMLGTFMLATAFASGVTSRPFTNRAVRWVGDRSYGVYVIHYVVMAFAVLQLGVAGQRGGLLEFAKWVAIVLPPSLLYGWASYQLVELPARHWARRVSRRWQQRPAVPEPVLAGAPATITSERTDR
jgi:peptidoglycan/LPS O-acetylase OafA/YrhL